ncbi:Juvenile hormone esterase [Frankliniella fusca]|uniref:Carboxylic ester hydrolase n=1 Tax=Frankliniella fusca TaxID=407009 RepID=A0AAE1LIJ7_9NEOP|nr:Juvenile hormone esterase [Frankliniella fusca]
MVGLSRKAILLSSAAIFVILVGVFFGVYMNHNGEKSSTTPSPTTLRPTTAPPTTSPATAAPSSSTPSPDPPQTPPRATIADGGDVEGKWIKSKLTGKWLAAFRGIPYAQPPVGALRFKGPRPTAKWEGTLKAWSPGNICSQNGDQGSEDCLYLNVFTPIKGGKPLPVYVFIHGGIFQYGSGGEESGLGPDFLVEQDVIVVTMNYRLGVIGYLSLDTEDVPGNLGLKDALFALQWVQKNIAAFGGDPSMVTLGGQSSGGVSASWLSILPATKGLIRAATVQSGTAVSGWSLNLKNVEFAKAIYKYLKKSETSDLAEIAKVLYSATPKELYDAAEACTLQLQADNKGLGTDISFFYLPTLELRPDGEEGKLITKDPESYIIQMETDIPIILGETKREWAQFLQLNDMYKNPTTLDNAIKNLITLVPNSLLPGANTQKLLGIEKEVKQMIDDKEDEKYAQKITERYFTQNTDVDCGQRDICKMAKYLDHAYIMVDTDHLLRLRAKYTKSPTYAYVFNLKSDFNGDYSSFPDYLQNAVFHGADMRYIWASTDNEKYDGKSAASKYLQRQVTLFTNFIKYRNPTPETSELITELWLPVNNGGGARYLEITENLKMQDGSTSGSTIWEEIFSHFRVGKSP